MDARIISLDPESLLIVRLHLLAMYVLCSIYLRTYIVQWRTHNYDSS